MSTLVIRLPDEELAALRERAVSEGRSMNDLARESLRFTVADRDRQARTMARRLMAEHAELLDRLADQ